MTATSRRPRQTLRERQDTAGTALARVRALARDPHLYRVAELITESNKPPHERGGRPRRHPDWCLVIFGACIRIFGSASATARALKETLMWEVVLHGAREVNETAGEMPSTPPTRDNWIYFVKSRLNEVSLQQVLERQRGLAVERAREIGLLERLARQPVGGYKRENVVGIDGQGLLQSGADTGSRAG